MKQKGYNIPWSEAAKLFLLLLFLTMFTINSSKDSETKSEFGEGELATISHIIYDFTIEYPAEWQAQKFYLDGNGGDDDVKLELEIHPRQPFGVEIRYNPEKNPTLQDVSNWGDIVMGSILTVYSVEEYPDTVNGKPVIRHRYKWGGYVTEDVYIARSNDMIIISMDVPQDDYENKIDDFNAIVESFRPFE